MSSRKKPGAPVKKKPYTKPEVKQVQLKPEEAVLGVCKLSGQVGPGIIGCGIGPSPCFDTHS